MHNRLGYPTLTLVLRIDGEGGSGATVPAGVAPLHVYPSVRLIPDDAGVAPLHVYPSVRLIPDDAGD